MSKSSAIKKLAEYVVDAINRGPVRDPMAAEPVRGAGGAISHVRKDVYYDPITDRDGVRELQFATFEDGVRRYIADGNEPVDLPTFYKSRNFADRLKNGNLRGWIGPENIDYRTPMGVDPNVVREYFSGMYKFDPESVRERLLDMGVHG